MDFEAELAMGAEEMVREAISRGSCGEFELGEAKEARRVRDHEAPLVITHDLRWSQTNSANRGRAPFEGRVRARETRAGFSPGWCI